MESSQIGTRSTHSVTVNTETGHLVSVPDSLYVSFKQDTIFIFSESLGKKCALCFQTNELFKLFCVSFISIVFPTKNYLLLSNIYSSFSCVNQFVLCLI